MLSADQTLNKGRYRIANQFGTDGAGSLFEAYDTINKSNVVLRGISSAPGKILTTSQRDAAEAIFVGNAKVLTKFRHGNLVAIQDYFTEVGNQYLVLENIVGFDLTEYTKRDSSRPSVAQAVKWTLDLLQALEYLHKLSPPIIHGNISPKNIRFRDERTAKLLALEVNTSVTSSSAQRSENSNGDGEHDLSYQPLERYWHTLGQLTQRSILRDYDERSERILLHKLDARSDMYALAACLYHVLTGVGPVSAFDRACALHEGKADPLVAMSKIDTSIPEDVSAIFMKALSVRREFRFYSAAVMAETLREALVDAEKVEDVDVQDEEVIVLDDDTPLEALPPEFRREELEAAIASDELEVQLELELTQAEERQRQLEAEQAKLEQEQKRIEEKRAALEAERLRHQAEKVRLEEKAKLESERKENERRAEEKKRLEAEALRERELASQRLAEIEAELEQRRLEAENIEREIEEERQRTIERLTKAREEKERTVAEQRKQAEAIKQKLALAEQRLQQITSSPAPPKDVTERENEVAKEVETVETAATIALPAQEQANAKKVVTAPSYTRSDTPEITFHSVPTGSSSRKRLVLMAVLGAVFAGAATIFWFVSQAGPSPAQPASVVIPETPVQEPIQNLTSATEPLTAGVSETNSNVSTANISNGSSSQSQVAVEDHPAIDQQSALRTDSAQSQSIPAKKKSIAAPTKPSNTKKVTVDDLINDN